MAYKIISVSYGHGTPNGAGKYTASGKLYDYTTEKEYRTGDVVVVPVQHAKSGRLYNTLAVVQMTHNFDSSAGARLGDHLTDPKNSIKPKEVGLRFEVAKRNGLDVQSDRDVNVTTLPGYSTRDSKQKWTVPRGNSKSASRLISRGD